MLKLVIAAAAFLGTVVAEAQASDLSGQEINELLAGATVEIDTPVGTKLPIRYGADGKLAGEAGNLAWFLGTPTDRGRWWVEAGQLCHKWYRWFEGEPQCLRLRREGRRIRWRKDSHSGTASITVPAPKQVALALAGASPGISKKAAPPEPPPAPLEAPEKQPEAPIAGDEGALPERSKEAAANDALPGGKQATKDLITPPAPILVVPEKRSPPESKDAVATEASPGGKQAAKDVGVPPAPIPVVPGKGRPPESKAESKAQTQAEPKRPLPRVYKVANVRSDDVLNVRSGPSSDFQIVGALPPGARGIAITSACRSQWCPVQHDATTGWVNSAYLSLEWSFEEGLDKVAPPRAAFGDSPEAPRSCLSSAARGLLERIEKQFGPVQVISTCRPGATMTGTWRPSRHASGNAIDFKAGSRTDAIIAWLIANHRRGGTMTYPGMDHVHVDIGPHFISIAGGPRWASWRDSRTEFPGLR